MEDLIAALEARGLRSFVLSSSPLALVRTKRLRELSAMAHSLICSNSDVLTADDVESALTELREGGERVLACVTVWEGYRGLMAFANAKLGVADCSVAQVTFLRNKLAVRNHLAAAGLSHARAMALTRDNFESLKSGERAYFIKPVCGIASYGAFALRPDTTWSAIQRIAKEAQSDEIYRSAFGAGLAFMAEDYVPGREFSFELLVISGRAYVLAIHEKCAVTETAGTVLEDACASPPISVDAAACAAGIEWINSALRQLGLEWGCFHVEARHDGARWDLIEINPRVGGCLISPSVKALNGKAGVLELWLDLLVASSAGSESALDAFEGSLAMLSFNGDGTPPYEHATFFRAYFARVGKLDYVGVRAVEPAPILSQLFITAGTEITQASREVFLGQVLWRVPRHQLESSLPALMDISEQAVEVRYAVSDAVCAG
ncbi:ATP-grasp domain-containing protein [Burkholderia sp. 8Y]|uniref:ATP-grasp domain-containing protein n=1 Tax=Burkholderia sp. 8Y TaxID=2653133 RepID=UPI001F458C4E|nr:ATP-grasp domain-containing protein [Burkholderia sp. 8Y]